MTQLDKDKITRNFWTYLVLGMALAAMTFFGVCDPSGQVSGPTGSAAVVADEEISRQEFNRAYQSTYSRYQQQLGESFDPARMKLANNVMDQLIAQRIQYVAAVNMGLKASDREVEEILIDAELFKDDKGQFNEEAYDNYLRSNGYSEASFMNEVRRNLTTQKLRRFLTELPYVSSKAAELDYRLQDTKLNLEYVKVAAADLKVDVSSDELKAFMADEGNKKKIEDFYTTNKVDYDKPERVKARHILVSYEGARNATPAVKGRTKEEAKKRAQSIFAKASAEGADFVAVAKENTDEAVGKTSGGDLGWFTRDAMVKEFSDAAFAMKAGEVKGPVESPFGFHIIKVENKEEAKKIELADASEDIAKTLLTRDKRPELAKARAAEIVKAAQQGDAAAVLKKYNLTWQETGDVSLTARNFPGMGSATEVRDAVLTLDKAGDVFGEPIDVRGDFFAIRLKAIKPADIKSLDEKEQEELARSASFSRGFQLFNSLEKNFRDRFEEKKQIRINPDYLALDNPVRQETTGG